jgi:hypothetical protein
MLRSFRIATGDCPFPPTQGAWANERLSCKVEYALNIDATKAKLLNAKMKLMQKCLSYDRVALSSLPSNISPSPLPLPVPGGDGLQLLQGLHRVGDRET